MDGEFRTKTGLSRNAFDFDRSVIDFRDLKLKQFDDKLRIRSRKNDFRTVNAIFHRLDIATDAFADLILFSGNPFAIWQQRFVFAEINANIRTLETAHSSADDVANAILELTE